MKLTSEQLCVFAKIPDVHPHHATSSHDVLERYWYREKLFKNGKLQADCQMLGICPSWLGQLHEQGPRVFLAEQLAPLPTLFGNQGFYGTPRILYTSLYKIFAIQDAIRKVTHKDCEAGQFALPDDGVSFSGINSLFHFFLPEPSSALGVRPFRLHSCRERKELFGTGFNWLTFDRSRIAELLQLLSDSRSLHEAEFPEHTKAVSQFMRDITEAIVHCGKSSKEGRVSYPAFVHEFNKRFVQRLFPGREFETGFHHHVATFLTSGVKSWPTYVGWLTSRELLKRGDSIGRLRIGRPGKTHRYSTIVLEEFSSSKVTVKNRDTGEIHDIEALVESSRGALAATGVSTFIPTMVSNYLVIYGLGNYISLVDGAPFPKAERLSLVLANPAISGVSAQKLTTLGYTALLEKRHEEGRSPYDGLVPCFSVMDYYRDVEKVELDGAEKVFPSIGSTEVAPIHSQFEISKNSEKKDQIVAKFGGTSVGNSARIRNVMQIIEQHPEYSFIVISAYEGVTDELIRLARMAVTADGEYSNAFGKLQKRHLDVAADLLGPTGVQALSAELSDLFLELSHALAQLEKRRLSSVAEMDLIMSFGERLSALTVCRALQAQDISRDVEFIDTREVIRTDSNFGSAEVDFVSTGRMIQERLRRVKGIGVLTGFIGSTVDGMTTTLGRGGADYTAAIVGAAINAKEIAIWTDVNGILTADPRKVPHAVPHEMLSYEEAWNLCRLGAKVVYPPTLLPAKNKKIPIRILNTFDPGYGGTLISDKPATVSRPVTGISSIERVAVVRVQVPSSAEWGLWIKRLRGTLAGAGVNLLLELDNISSREVLLVVLPHQTTKAIAAANRLFNLDIDEGAVSPASVVGYQSIVSLLSSDSEAARVAMQRALVGLASDQLPIVSLAESSATESLRSIMLLVDCQNEIRALNRLHEELF